MKTIVKQFFDIASQLKYLLFAFIVAYGTFFSVVFALQNVFCIVLIAVTVSAALAYFRLPPVHPAALDTVLGRIDNETGPELKSIGHRGVALDAPENSIEGFRLAAQNGIKFVEFDVRLSKDNVPVLIHDITLERLTGTNVKVCDITYHELSRFDISVTHAFGSNYKNSRIPTLEVAVRHLLQANQKMIMDLKENSPQLIESVLKLFCDNRDLVNHAVIQTFCPITLYKIRKANPRLVCSLVCRPYFFSRIYTATMYTDPVLKSSSFWWNYVSSALDVIFEWSLSRVMHHLIGISVLTMQKDCISYQTATDWLNKGVRVIAWTVNSPVEKRYFGRILKMTYITDTVTAETTTHGGRRSDVE